MPTWAEVEKDRAAFYALAERIAHHSVGIIVDHGTGVGTGAAILWAGRRLIVTARHVIIDDDPETISFLLPPDAPMILPGFDHAGLRAKAEVVIVQKLKVDDIVSEREADLAAIVLSLENALPGRLAFFEVDANSRSPSAGTLVLVHGLPRDLAKQIGLSEVAVFPAVEIGWGERRRRP